MSKKQVSSCYSSDKVLDILYVLITKTYRTDFFCCTFSEKIVRHPGTRINPSSKVILTRWTNYKISAIVIPAEPGDPVCSPECWPP